MQTGSATALNWTHKLIARLCASLVTAVLLGPIYGHARDGQQIPLDAVILMDDSGSMRGTDPLKLRFSAFSLFIRLLRDEDSIGVVKFDDAASVVMPLHPLGTDHARRALDKTARHFSTRGAYTDIYAGLKMALQEVKRRGRQQAQKAVILISDGLMDVNPAARRNDEATRLLHEALLPEYQEAQVKIVALALSPAADRAFLETIAVSTGGTFFYTPHAMDLSAALFSIFDGLKAPDMLAVKDQRVSIDASVKEATFLVIANPSKGEVTLVRPDGVRVRRKSQDPAVKWFVGQDYVVCTVQRPLPGEWHVETAGRRPTKVVVVTDIRLEARLDRETYFTGQEVQISARLVGVGHAGAIALPLDELEFRASVYPPDAPEGSELPLSREGHWRAVGAPGDLATWYGATYVLPSSPGKYRGRVTATAPTFSREKSFSFQVLVPQAISASSRTSANAAPFTPEVSDPASVEEEMTGGEALLQDLDQEPPQPSPWSDALWKLAIVHGALFVLGGGAMLGRRLARGSRWLRKPVDEPALPLVQEDK